MGAGIQEVWLKDSWMEEEGMFCSGLLLCLHMQQPHLNRRPQLLSCGHSLATVWMLGRSLWHLPWHFPWVCGMAALDGIRYYFCLWHRVQRRQPPLPPTPSLFLARFHICGDSFSDVQYVCIESTTKIQKPKCIFNSM